MEACYGLQTTDYGLPMPISFKCPHCQKSLKVKDHLAGKKGACPNCKKALMIPVPVDYEALAAAALSETPQTTKVEEQQELATKVARTIDFTCPYCEAELHLNADLGGKKEPCPECKRIIKVPMLVQERAKDWRTVQQKTGPSAALANAQQPQLEGVWDTTQKARVSTEALEEADAIIEEDEDAPGALGWIKRGVIIGGVVGLIVLAIVLIMRWQSAGTQADALKAALAMAEGKGEKFDLSPPWRAEVFRAAGEFYIGKDEPNKALAQLKKARGQFPRQTGATPLDQDLMLMRLAGTLVDLGGSEKEIGDELRLDWGKVQQELFSTLGGIAAPEVKALAVRDVAARLMKKQQAPLAVVLVRRLSADDGSPVKAQWVGLAHDPALPLEEKTLKEMLDLVKRQVPAPNPAKGIFDRVARVGYAEAYARAGKYDEVGKIIEAAGPGDDRVEAALVAADVVEEKSAGDGKKFRDTAFQLSDKLKNALSPWLRLQIVQAALRAGDMERAQETAKTIPTNPNADYKSWAELAIFRAELAKSPGEADMNLVLNSRTDKNSLARALAWEALARHNIRYSSDIRRSVETVEDPRVRPFLLVGITLGSRSPEP
jgi:hypothetical protein